MSGQLERFINDHREEFDGEEPAKKIWDGIRQKLEPERQASRVVRMGFKRWSIAASVAILVIAGTVYLLVRRSDAFSVTPVAAVPGSVPKKSVPPANHILPDSALPRPAIRQLATVKGQNRIEGSSRKSQGEDISSDVSKEMVYYA
ncbi:MAG TPA: hypothetical protein VKR32_00865, partial [Puia sp.]|nr:hypothetical protein [Puia sp.]